MSQVQQAAPKPWLVGVVSGMASYIDSAAIVSFGIAIVILEGALGLTPAEIGLASGALTFSIAIGAIFGGRLGDRFGRRPVFTITMLVIIVGVLSLIFSFGFVSVLVGAVLVGLGTGADLPVSLSTISEAASGENRGKLLGFSNILWLAGITAAIAIGTFAGGLGVVGAQIMFAHIGVVALIVMIARLRIPESAVWKAARAERASGVNTKRASRANIGVLFSKPYLAPMLTLVVFYALTNLAANTAGQFNVYLLVNIAGVDVSTASLLELASIPVTALLYFWFMRVADSPKRFRYFVGGSVFFVVSQLVPAIFGFSVLTYLISTLLLAVGLAFAFEGIMKVWSQESFPTLVRTTAQGTIIAVARVAAALLAAITPLIIEVGVSVLYFTLAALAAVGLLLAWSTFRTRDKYNVFDDEAGLETRNIRTVG